MNVMEVNFDGLVGPTHNYAGLSFGNVASSSSVHQSSRPKEAAKQGLLKMKALMDLGLVQGVIPPHERPDVNALRRLGFRGSDEEVLRRALKEQPRVFAACCSASGMWTANAATVSPSPDTDDGRLHLTTANLCTNFHRSLEPPITHRILQAIFADPKHFQVHEPLPYNPAFGDEGAANHTRFAKAYGEAGLEFFVFGKHALKPTGLEPKKYPARQTWEACIAVKQLHGLQDANTLMVQQNPDVIDEGVFHNDVISVGNLNVLLAHQDAFVDTPKVVDQIKHWFGDDPFYPIIASSDQVPVADAVESYLYNSQVIQLPESGQMAIVAPMESHSNQRIKDYLDSVVEAENPIAQVIFKDLKQSMKNGGGPACLRLRVVMSEAERQAVNQHCLLSNERFDTLNHWVDKHYRETLTVDELADPSLLMECRQALDELTQILNLGSIYRFQQG